MKQTAVEWLFQMMNNPNNNQLVANKLFAQAKQMEKQQIEDAHYDGQLTTSDYGAYSEYSEQYYKQNFGE